LNPISDKRVDAVLGASFGLFDRLRHRCANRYCPERGRLWPSWLNRSEEVEFEGRRYCCAPCAEPAFQQEIERHLLLARQERERPHRIPLGLLLISRGLITSGQLQEALRRQIESAGRSLGSLLREMGAVSEAALTTVLGVQWGCPVFPLEKNRDYLDCASLVPFALQQSAGVLPAHYSSANKILHLAFTKRIDHTLLYAIERMTGYRAMPCIATDRLVSEALHRVRASAPLQETVLDSVRQPQEMARMAAGYAGKLRAARAQIVGAADHVWFRFDSPRRTHHLLFHSPPERPPAVASLR
jgi:Type II secretion system (T2SS), protein E, N-terminal domain